MKSGKNEAHCGDESGSVLLVILAGVVPLAILAAAMTLLLNSRVNNSNSRMAGEQQLAFSEGVVFEGLSRLNAGAVISALPLAESSLQHGTDGLDNDKDGQVDETDEIGEVRIVCDWSADSLDNDGDTVVDEDDERVRCLLENRRRDADGLDNDSDSTIDEPDENYMIKLIGISKPWVGYSGSRDKIVELYLQYSSSLLPDSPAALYIDDPNADLKFNGNSFLISGHDIDWAGNPTGVSLPGVGVNGSPTIVTNILKNNQNANVIGLGPSPSVAGVTVPNPFGLSLSVIDDMLTVYAPVCDIFYAGGGTLTSNPQGSDGVDNDGDSLVDEADESNFGNTGVGEMKIMYVDGDVHFSGQNTGAGMLLVNGELEITGQFVWHGVVVVKGDIRLSGGGAGGKHIYGAVHIGADITDSNVTIGGNAEIQYSQTRIDRLSGSMGGYRVWAFKER